MKLYCETCNIFKAFEVKSLSYKVTVKGVEVNACIDVCYCKTCGQEVYNRDLEIKNDIIVFDAYKSIKGLLTSSDIKAIRNKYHISQTTFAKVLGFGEKTITRYENGSIQDDSSNNLILLAKDQNNFYVLWKNNKNKLTKAENIKIKESFDRFTYEQHIDKTKQTKGSTYTFATSIKEENN